MDVRLSKKETITQRNVSQYSRDQERVTYLGMVSSFGVGIWLTFLMEAYAEPTLVCLSMESKMAQPRSRHFESPVVRQRI